MTIETRVETALSSSPGRVVAFMLGHRFRRFPSADRAPLADRFAEHGFEHVAELVRTVTPGDALAAVVGRHGKTRCSAYSKAKSNGSTVVFSLDKLESEPDVRSWGVYRAERPKGERGSKPRIGARVFASAALGIVAAPPVDEPEDPDCRALADALAAEAREHQLKADTSDVGHALTTAYVDAGCYSFISRGLYLAEVSAPATPRLVALVDAVREAYWSDATREGVRVRAVKVTESDVDSVSDAVLDDLERKVAQLVNQLRVYQAQGAEKTRETTLTKRREDCARILQQIERHKFLLGDWAARFGGQAESLRDAFNAAVSGAPLDLPDWAESAGDPDAEDESAPASAPAAAAAPSPAVAPSAPAPQPQSEEEVFESGSDPDDAFDW